MILSPYRSRTGYSEGKASLHSRLQAGHSTPGFDCGVAYGHSSDLGLVKFHQRARLPLHSVRRSVWGNTAHIPAASAFLGDRVCSPQTLHLPSVRQREP